MRKPMVKARSNDEGWILRSQDHALVSRTIPSSCVGNVRVVAFMIVSCEVVVGYLCTVKHLWGAEFRMLD